MVGLGCSVRVEYAELNYRQCIVAQTVNGSDQIRSCKCVTKELQRSFSLGSQNCHRMRNVAIRKHTVILGTADA